MVWLSARARQASGALVGGGKRTSFNSPKVRFTPEERLRDMDLQGVDVQALSIHTPFFGYHLDPAQGLELARDFNDEVAALSRGVAGALCRPGHPADAGCPRRRPPSWSAR